MAIVTKNIFLTGNFPQRTEGHRSKLVSPSSWIIKKKAISLAARTYDDSFATEENFFCKARNNEVSKSDAVCR